MASNIMGANGESTVITNKGDIKILVVGEKNCGKSQFIKVFFESNQKKEQGTDDKASAYPCRYEINGEVKIVNIYEIPYGIESLGTYFEDTHDDANAIAFLYAVDDPSSFQAVKSKWLSAVKNITNFTKKGVLIGTKKDLRSDPRVIERLARVGQAPVTIEQGEALVVEEERLLKYYDCSPIDLRDGQSIRAFHFLVESGLGHLINNPHLNE